MYRLCPANPKSLGGTGPRLPAPGTHDGPSGQNGWGRTRRRGRRVERGKDPTEEPPPRPPDEEQLQVVEEKGVLGDDEEESVRDLSFLLVPRRTDRGSDVPRDRGPRVVPRRTVQGQKRRVTGWPPCEWSSFASSRWSIRKKKTLSLTSVLVRPLSQWCLGRHEPPVTGSRPEVSDPHPT